MMSFTQVIVCVLLASTMVLIQELPQRVERRSEYRWCHDEHQGWLERRVVHVVDGKEAGAAETNRLFTTGEVSGWGGGMFIPH